MAAAAARGARWATAGGFPLLPALCDALRVPPPLARSYQAGLAAFHAAHGGSTALLALLVACVLIPLGRAAGTPLFAAVGRRALRRAAPGGDGPVGAAALRKWCEASWKLVAYTTLTAFGLAVTAGQPWAADTTLLWAGWPEAHDHPPPLRAFYAAQVGHYLYSAVDLCCWETRRKDFAAMLAHHGATLALLLVSFAFSFLRVGALIEVLHDACDVWMEGAKLCKYAGFNAWSTAIFVVFLLSWVALRMLLLPLVVIRSTSVETAVLLAAHGGGAAHVAARCVCVRGRGTTSENLLLLLGGLLSSSSR